MISRSVRSAMPTLQVSPSALGARLDVGGRATPQHQAQQRTPAQQRLVAAAGEPPGQRAEDRRVGDPVERGVEHRAEPAASRPARATAPSTMSSITNAVMTSVPDEELAAGVEDQRADA